MSWLTATDSIDYRDHGNRLSEAAEQVLLELDGTKQTPEVSELLKGLRRAVTAWDQSAGGVDLE